MWNLSSSPFLCRHAIPWRRRRRRLSPHSVGMRPVGQQQFANFRSGAVADLASWKMRDVDLIREQFEAGWWFGTCFIFPYIGNVIIPTDWYFFQGTYGKRLDEFCGEHGDWKLWPILGDFWGRKLGFHWFEDMVAFNHQTSEKKTVGSYDLWQVWFLYGNIWGTNINYGKLVI